MKKLHDWQCAPEWKLEDLWIGVFWKRTEDVVATGPPKCALPIYDRLDIWICLLPCVPIHLAFWFEQA